MRGWIQESVMVDSVMASVDTAVLGAVGDIPRKPWYVSFGQLLRKQPLGAAGGLIVLLMLLATIFANVLSPYDPELASFENMLVPPNALHQWKNESADPVIRVTYNPSRSESAEH